MGFIKQIKLPNNEVQYMKNTIIPVIGTQANSTSSWTGNIDLPSLYDGLTIVYFLPYNSVSGTSVSLTLTLNDGSQTDPIACYISSDRLGTQYTKGSNIIMTYWSKGSINIDGTVTTNNRWIAHANYNTNTNTWRNIQVNGTQVLATGTGTGALNFINGTNTTVTYDSGVKINATDTKVIQSNTVNSGVRPLIMENNAYIIDKTSGDDKNIETDYDSTDTTGKVYRTNNIYASPAYGRLYLSSTSSPQMYLKYRTLDYTTANNNLSAAQWVGYRILDKNNNVVSLFHLEAATSGLIKTIMRATNYNITTSSTTTGYIGVQVDKNSNVGYLISHKDKFREAIEVYSKLETETPIRSYLTSTVGHTCKNLLPITLESGTYTSGGANLTYTVDKAAGTITINGSSRTDTSAINLTLYNDISGTLMSGNLYASGGSTHCGIRAYDYDSSFENKWCRKWDGETTSSSSMGEHDNQECQIIAGHNTVYRIRIAANQTINNEVIKPMFRDGSIIDDTFEPYVTPTDEAKQDKPVTLLAFNDRYSGYNYPSLSDLKSKYYMIIVCVCYDSKYYTVIIPTASINNIGYTHYQFYVQDSNIVDSRVSINNVDGKAQFSQFVGTATASEPSILSWIIAFPK